MRSLSSKEQGEAAEAAFLTRALGLGMWVSRPWGDSAPYDAIVEGGRRLYKVQIKSAGNGRAEGGGSQKAMVCRGNKRKRAYRKRDVDIVAVLLGPEGAWYIIPVRALRGRKTIRLGSKHKTSHRLFEKYREAWGLLR